MARQKILYTDTGMKDVDIERLILSKAGIDLVTATSTDPETLIIEGAECDGIMVEYAEIDKEILDAWGSKGKVKIVCRQGIGYNNINIDAASNNKIMVSNVPDYCLEEVADHTIGLVLNLVRQINILDNRVKGGDFSEIPPRPIHRIRGQKFCLYGFGNIAKAVAIRAQAFGFEVYAYDPNIAIEDFELHKVKNVSTLEDLAAIADVLTIHVPSIESTFHTIDSNILNKMKRNSIIINTARGSIVNEKNIIDALNDGVIFGAGLDVFEGEPLQQDNPLTGMENVILTPHISWNSEEAEMDLRVKIAENIVLALTEGKPRNFINKEAFK